MSESLSRRVRRLVSGGFHAVLDTAENFAPEAVLNEHIREVERAIDEVRGELGKVLAQKHLAAKKLADEGNRHESLSDQIQAALNAKRDDLAAAGVAEQMDIEARLLVLENTIADCAAQERELSDFVAALQSTRREMQQNLADWKAAQNQNHMAGGAVSGSKISQIAHHSEKSSQNFERVLQRHGGMPLNGAGNQASSLRELEELSRQNRVAERLAALKAGKS